MKSYIAYGENGKNLVFDTQSELRAHFELNEPIEVIRLVEKGKPIEDPDTQVKYYIDELERDEK